MPPPASRTVALAIRGPLCRTDLPGLYARVCEILRENAGALVLCDVGNVSADAVAVEALARLRLGARRTGCRIRLLNPSDDLRDVVDLLGLTEALAGIGVSRGGAEARRAGTASWYRGRT